MTRLWPAGEPIAVRHNDLLEPCSFDWRGRRCRVERIAKRWRLDQGWWQRRIRREYFKLTTREGLLVVIYYDWIGGTWYLQRIYD